MITKGQKYSCFVNVTPKIFEKHDSENKLLNFRGKLEYKKTKNSLFTTKEYFFLTLEPYRTDLNYRNEYINFIHEGAKLHDDLVALNNTLKTSIESNKNN